MDLRFVTKVVNVGINCSTKNSDNLISKEGLIAIIKDSCDRNGIDNVLSVLTSGISYLEVDTEILKKYLEDRYKTSKGHNITNYEINYVSSNIYGRTEYKRRRFINPNDSYDYRSQKDDVHTIEDWYDDYDNFNISIEDYNKAEEKYSSPVEECE